MKKKFLFLTLMGAMLLPVNVGAQDVLKPYKRKNKSDYRFDGHKVEEVTVQPYAAAANVTYDDKGNYVSGNVKSTTINVASDADDNQVVFLYNPATKRFLYADGNWGTEAVGRYEGFGMPYNIVNPKGGESPLKTHYKHDGWPISGDYSSYIGYGLYCEAFEMGHYLGRDAGNYVGQPEFTQDGQTTNRARFFTDRGGSQSWSDTYDRNLKAMVKRVGNGIPQAERENTFTWGFEEVTTPDPNLHVYHLCIYLNNEEMPEDANGTFGPLYKHYVKFEEIDPFGNSPFYALTTADCNTKNEKNKITGDAAEPSADEYLWQIVTRKDLRRMFLLEYREPFNLDGESLVVDDGATFMINNPDFSRPLRYTVKPAGGDVPSFWTESQDDLYYFYHHPFSLGEDPGRFSILHANNNGDLTQKFKTYQYGLYRLDCQGFSFGGAKATMSLETASGASTKVSGAVTFDDDVTLETLGLGELIKQRSKDNYGNTLYSDANKAKGDVTDWTVWNDNKWHTEPVAGGLVLASITPGNGQKRPVQFLGEADASGARPVGVYVVGKEKPFTTTHPYIIGDGEEWQRNQTITVREGDKIKFGLNPGDYDNCVKLDVWYPDNTSDHNHWSATENINAEREHVFTVGGTDNQNIRKSGDYIFTFQYNDGTYAVDYYTIQIEGQGTPTHVNVNETGKPYAFGETNVNVKLTQEDGGGQDAGDWRVKNDAGWIDQNVTKYNDNEYFARVAYYGESGAYADNEKKSVLIISKDQYGRRPTGVYIPGEQNADAVGMKANYEINYDDGSYYQGWVDNVDNGTTISVRANDQIHIRPQVPNKSQIKKGDWWVPAWGNAGGGYDHRDGGNDATKEDQFDFWFTADYANAGDYVFVGQYNDGTFAVYSITVKVIGAPDPVHVNVNGTGKPYAFGNPGNYISIATQTYSDYNNYGIADQTALQTYAEKHDRRAVDYAVGTYLYNDDNKGNYKKSIYFYVPTADKEKDLTIKFAFTGIERSSTSQYDFDHYAAIDNVRITYLGDVPYVLDEKAVNNTQINMKEATYEWVPVYMKRHFSKGAWNAFVCPVPLTLQQLKTAFGNEVKLSEITKHGLNPNDPLQIVFENKLTGAAADKVVVWPGHFYLVKPDENNFNTKPSVPKLNDTDIVTLEAPAGEDPWEFVYLGMHNLSHNRFLYEEGDDGQPDKYKLAELHADNELVSESGRAVLQGDWKDIDNVRVQIAMQDPVVLDDGLSSYIGHLISVPEDSPYASLAKSPYRNFHCNRYTQTQEGLDITHNAIELVGSYLPLPVPYQDPETTRANCYVFGYNKKTGKTNLIHLNGSTVQRLDGFRFYIRDVENYTAPAAKPFTFIVDDEDDSEATEIINALIGDDGVGDGEIYNLAGQKVKGQLNKGVYVRNGKKFLVK